LNNSSHVITRADFLVADDFSVCTALARLTAVQMRNAGCANSVFLPIVFAFALLGIARNHSRLCASTCVASIGVNPGKSDLVLLAGIAEAEADLVFALDLAAGRASALVALVGVGLSDSHREVRVRVAAAHVARASHLKTLGLTGASVSALVSRLGKSLASGILDAVIVALAVDAIVRNEVSAALRTGEPRASISGSDDLTDRNHSPVIRTPTSHQSTNNGSCLSAPASVTILLKGLSNRICDAILNA